MKVHAAAALAALILFAGQAKAGSYFEASLGAAILPTIDTKPFTITDPTTGDVFKGKGFLNYGTTVTTGAEVGWADLSSSNIRVGLGWDYLEAKLSSAGITGTLNGVQGTFTVPGSAISAAGFNFNNSVHVLGPNVSYDLPLLGGAIRPYVGAGIGTAIFQRAGSQLAASATVGARYALSEDMYVGARYRFYHINGPTDKLGIEYSPITAHTISLLLGFYAD